MTSLVAEPRLYKRMEEADHVIERFDFRLASQILWMSANAA
jgi:hypothetical protein